MIEPPPLSSYLSWFTYFPYVANLLFAVWPLIVFLAPLGGKKKLAASAYPRMALAMWVLMAVCLGIARLEPQNTTLSLVPIPAEVLEALFFPTGLGLVALWLLTRRRQQQVLVRKAADARTLEDLLALSPSEFEAMVAHLYNQSGHQARRTGQTGDQGIDLVVQAKNGEKWVVQCKRWRGSVGAPVIRDFYGAMQHEKADKGTVITTGKFTRQAREWAAGKPITLYDGEKLIQVWRQAQGASS